MGAMPRKMMEGRMFIGRSKGRPRWRWMDGCCSIFDGNEDKTVDRAGGG